ncbi:MAG: NAD-dependent epimerase/dehydratase family protein [Candidatus Thorarchaeota archaeon]
MSSKSSVLVTGVCGFIGSSTAARLVESGYKVYGLDLPGQSLPSHIHLGPDSFNLIHCNLIDDDLEKIIPSDVELVIHAAGITSIKESFENPLIYENVNVLGTIRLLTALKKRRIRRLIFISSIAVYGNFLDDFDEQRHPTNPLNPYSISKLAAEKYIQALSNHYNFEYVILRLTNVYGPHQELNEIGPLQVFISSALRNENFIVFGDGNRTRSYVHIQDVTEAITLALETKQAAGATLNICGDRSYTILEIARMVLSAFQTPSLRIIHEEPTISLVENVRCLGERAKAVLGFWPKHSLSDGINQVVTEYITKYHHTENG